MKAMKLTTALARLLALFALVGVLIAPVSVVAAEATMANVSRAAVIAMGQMAGMNGDMSCCPDEATAKRACENCCPFIAICSTAAHLALPRVDWISVVHSRTGHVYGAQRVVPMSSLAAEPLARPPKT